MNEEELALDSDSSDEDYKPAGAENELSEEESGNESEEPCSDPEISNKVKKRKKIAKGRARKKIRNGKRKEEEEKEEEKENSEVVLTEEEKKKKSDLLWADFLRDTGPPASKSQPAKQDTVVEPPSNSKSPYKEIEQKPKQETEKTTQILTFAGEEVKVEKPVTPEIVTNKKSRGSGGLSSVLSLIGKKGKLSTLEKSKLDWERFKNEQGIKEDIETYNKGKNGYLEKQDFLQRADVRQFEIEKSMRASRRSLNR